MTAAEYRVVRAARDWRQARTDLLEARHNRRLLDIFRIGTDFRRAEIEFCIAESELAIALYRLEKAGTP